MNFPPPTSTQARVIWAAVTGLAVALLGALIVGLFWLFGRVVNILSPVLWPLAVAGVIAYLLDPVVDFLERRRIPRTRAILIVFVIALLTIAALFSSIVPQLVQESRRLSDSVPRYVNQVQLRIEHWINHPPNFIRGLLPGDPSSTNTTAAATTSTNSEGMVFTNAPAQQAPGTNSPSVLQNALDAANIPAASTWAAKTLSKIGSWIFGQIGRVASWFGVLAGLALVPVYAFYFLLEKRGISSTWTDYLPVADSGFKEELVFVLNSINNYLISFFRGQVLVAICDGFMYTIGFLIIGLPYAVLIGVFSVFLTMIPFLGAIITCIVAVVIAIAQWGDWLHPLLVLAVFGVVQTLEGLVVSPKIMGDRVGLHPVTIIIAVMAGTTLLGGILGGILAIPLTAALRVLMFRYVWKKREMPNSGQPA
jgi:predicted PurR-regulated permease PerM